MSREPDPGTPGYPREDAPTVLLTDLPGRSIRHYQIEHELGRGGMGIVYLAHDTRLDRDVALKLLPEDVASDPARLAAFRREAKLLAVMNHPNIATIYGLEELPGGRQAIIMEFLEGETLSVRLRRMPLSLTETLEICEQIAVAVDQAHGRGVVHRDLKPGNTMLLRDGVVKVLDFGLARQAPDFEETVIAPLPEAAPSTVGVSRFAGTPGYMSPEQIRGEPDDQRTDVFAFGCILFECVTGHLAFGGNLSRERAAAALAGSVDWSVWPSEVPQAIRDLAVKCLQPDRGQRLTDLRGARDVLRSARGLAAIPAPFAGVQGLGHHATSFVGRSAEITEVERALRRNSLVTLTGLGGCGKTRLAQEVVRHIAPSFSDGAAFVDLAPIQDPDRVPLAVGTTLGLRGGGKAAIDVLADHFRDRQFLLALDNCEHLLDACTSLTTQLLRGSSGLKILATSREPLGVSGEQEFAVSPLPLPPEHDAPESLRDNEAVRLFVERARLATPGFDITRENGAAVAEICRRVDGIPLGIELAAARTKVLAPGQILARLQVDRRLLATGRSSTAARHEALDATIRWSYNHLTGGQQRTLRALSAFLGGWTLEAAEAIAGESADSFDTLDDLTQLVNKSLVVVEPHADGEFRYRMLETIRQFAGEELHAAGEESATRARHVDYFLGWALELEPHLSGPEPFTHLQRLDADRENLLVAVRYCEALPDGAQSALRLLNALDRYWIRRGHFELGQTAFQRAFALPGAERETVHRAKALCAAGMLALIRVTAAEGIALFQEAQALCRTLGDKRVAARALSGLGVCTINTGDYDAAGRYLEESIALSTEAGDVPMVAMATGNLAAVNFVRKEYALARSLFEKSVTMYREVQDIGGELTTLSGVSRSSLFLGDLASAREALRATVLLIRKLGDKRNGATALLTAGLLAVRMGQPRHGARLLAAGEALRATFGPQALLAPSDQAATDAAVATMRETLGTPALEAAWAEGKTLDFTGSLDAIMEFVADELPAYPAAGAKR